MEAVSLKIGPAVFRYADYDSENDLLFLSVDEPEPAEAEATPEGHAIHYAPGSDRIVGLTIHNPRYLLEQDGRLTVTFPEMVETRSAEEMAGILAAA
ncbi:MAG: hypothetical protein WBQ21_08995 [Solirubrobacteraceae bacterium]